MQKELYISSALIFENGTRLQYLFHAHNLYKVLKKIPSLNEGHFATLKLNHKNIIFDSLFKVAYFIKKVLIFIVVQSLPHLIFIYLTKNFIWVSRE